MGAAPKPVRWRMDFAGRKVLWFVISGVVVLISLGSLAVNGLNEGIDFKGGTRIDVTLEQPATPDDVRGVLSSVDSSLGDAVIRGRGTTAGQNSFTEFQVDAKKFPTDDVAAFTQGLRERYGVADQPDVRSVSASFGSEILRGAILAFIFSMFLIVVYIAFRFDWRYAVPMIVALLHDLIITVGVYSIFDREVSSATVAAVLTVLGYSLYDTIIVFDRVRENEAHLRKHTYDEIVNISLWETLTRSLNTSFITLLPILSLFIFGGETLQGLRLRAAHRHRLRRVLVVLHRRAAAGVHQGPPAGVQAAHGLQRAPVVPAAGDAEDRAGRGARRGWPRRQDGNGRCAQRGGGGRAPTAAGRRRGARGSAGGARRRRRGPGPRRRPRAAPTARRAADRTAARDRSGLARPGAIRPAP